VRINKYLALQGIASRRKIDALINSGLVLINGTKAELGTVLEEGDSVKCQGRIFNFTGDTQEKFLIAFNKPPGLVCTNDTKEKNNIYYYIKTNPNKFIGTELRYQLISRTRLFSIGRLDKESRGLILLTNDGELSQKLSHPKYEKEKEYIVTCEKEINKDFIKKFSGGVEIYIEDSARTVITQKTRTKLINKKTFSCVLQQGYKRQIRLMVQALGNKVTDLVRIRISDYRFEDLAEGYFTESLLN